MKKRILTLLSLVLLVGVLTLPVSAASLTDVTPGQAAKTMTFPTDGSNHTAICPVCCKSVIWYALDAATVSAGKKLSNYYHYYLAEDVDTTLDGPLISAASSTGSRCCLHLNGKKLINRGSIALQGSVSRFNVMGDGVVQGAKAGGENGAAVEINPGMPTGVVALYGGTYSKVDSASSSNVMATRTNGGIIELYDGATIQAGTAGSAVYLNSEMGYVSSVFRMYGGTLDASATSELAVDMEADTVKKANKIAFYMSGGVLKGGAAGCVTIRDAAAVYMSGGTIENGHITIEANGKMEISGGTLTGGSATNGGNIYIAPGAKLTMTGGTIQNGEATQGGNVYVDENAEFTMSGGTLTGGSATNGGNICLYYTGDTIEQAPPEFTMTGGTVEKGVATKEGGNIYAEGINDASKNAKIYLRNATISNGKATGNGGNMVLIRSTMTMDAGAKILNGVSSARAGNIRLYIGKIIMNDGLISGGSAATANTDNIWAYGVSNTYPGSIYMLGGVMAPTDDGHNSGVSLAKQGRLYLANDATFTNTDPLYAAVCIGSSNSVYGKLFVCDGWTGFADFYILNKGYSVGSDVSSTYIQVVKLNADLSTTAGGSFAGTLTQLYEDRGQLIPGASKGVLHVADAVLVSEDGKLTATTDPVTDWQTGNYAYLRLNSNLSVADLGGKELCVDLNGYDLTVGGSGNVKAFDTKNDEYISSVCGEIEATGAVTVEKDVFAPNGNRYVALTENGKITMRRLEMSLTAVTLRTGQAGLYYKAIYRCDKVLERAVSKYGIALSVFNMPGADFATETGDVNRYTVAAEAFKSGIVTTSGSVFNIMKDGSSASVNDKRGQLKIYANPYITVGGQTIVADNSNVGKTADDEDFDGIAYSLLDAMNTADETFFDYSRSDREQFASFYQTWQEKGMNWQFDNISDKPKAVDNSNLTLTADKGYCAVCKKPVTWKPITQAAYGTTPMGALSNGSHYYLAEDIVYTGADETFVRAPGTGSTACLHLNGFDLIATNYTAITGYAGTMNVLGNGTVMGNIATENSGAAVHINTNGPSGVINLYGGTYTLPQTNTTAAAVSVYNNGGEINLYEGVTVCGSGNCSVYMGEAKLRNAGLGIYGATVKNGFVNCAEPSNAAKYSCTLQIGGCAELEEVKVRSKNVAVVLFGAPKIDLMSMVANVAMELDGLSEGTDITVNTRGVFTKPSQRAEEFKQYFNPFVTTDTLTVEGDTLSYQVDFEQYMTPYIRDVSAEAIADGKIHYYAMSSEGMVTSPTSNDSIYKWGDSYLIVFPNGETMLVDTGYAMQQPWLIGNLKRMGIGGEENPLDYLLITHPHSDHQGAFYSPQPFFDEIQVKQVYHNKLVVSGSTTAAMVENFCTARNIPCTSLKQGTELDFGAVHMEVLWPAADTESVTITSGKINDNSMVFRLDYGEHSALFTGDIYVEAETQILNSIDHSKLDVDFLKVPHHGWNTSSSADFVNAVSPQIAVATSFLEMEEQIRRRYVATNTTLLMDVYDGYIHVSSGNDGVMTYETSR